MTRLESLEDTLATKRTALLAKAADLARQQAETAGAIAVLDELLGEAIQDATLDEIRDGMEAIRHAPVVFGGVLAAMSRDDRAEAERLMEHVDARDFPAPPAPHRMVPRTSEPM